MDVENKEVTVKLYMERNIYQLSHGIKTSIEASFINNLHTG